LLLLCFFPRASLLASSFFWGFPQFMTALQANCFISQQTE
jgi:hypothetical protein